MYSVSLAWSFAHLQRVHNNSQVRLFPLLRLGIVTSLTYSVAGLAIAGFGGGACQSKFIFTLVLSSLDTTRHVITILTRFCSGNVRNSRVSKSLNFVISRSWSNNSGWCRTNIVMLVSLFPMGLFTSSWSLDRLLEDTPLAHQTTGSTSITEVNNKSIHQIYSLLILVQVSSQRWFPSPAYSPSTTHRSTQRVSRGRRVLLD